MSFSFSFAFPSRHCPRNPFPSHPTPTPESRTFSRPRPDTMAVGNTRAKAATTPRIAGASVAASGSRTIGVSVPS
jgi:hypothetical protein